MTHTIVLYHANCWDGLTAAWSLGLDPQTTTYIEYDHGQPAVADVRFGRDLGSQTKRVIAVDCFPEFIRGSAPEVIVIDHHESAKERLDDRTGLTEVVFDMTHSAAVLAFQWAHPHATVPELVRYVEDRDIWNWKLPHSHAVNAYIGTKPMEMDTISHLLEQIQRHESFVDVVMMGATVLAYQAQQVKATAKRSFAHKYDGVHARTVNCTTNISEVGHELLEGSEALVAFMYRIDGDVMNVSVRTHPSSPVKANDIAARFGGGGHPQAAGFHIPTTFPLPWVAA